MIDERADAEMTEQAIRISELENRPNCGYCKDCKHWATEDHWATVNSKEHRACTLINPAEECVPEEELAYTIGYDASGTLLTKPTFGCVQFEPK